MITDIVNEKSDSTLECSFTDQNDEAVTPLTCTYNIIDSYSGTEIVADTPFSPPNIDISANDNRILNARKAYEYRLVTVKWTYGAGKQGAETYVYKVKNLNKI